MVRFAVLVGDDQTTHGKHDGTMPGVWRLQVTSDPDAVTGRTRRLSRTFRGTKADAKRALQRLVTEAGAGLQGGSEVTIATLLEQFMTTATMAPTTRADWQSIVNRHLTPQLGAIPLWKLTPRHCDQLYHRMAAAGLGPSRVRCAHVVLHRAVAQVVRWGWLARNPVSDATRPEAPRATVVPPDVDQIRELLAAAREQDPILACWLDVAAATGARRGEVCGLRWCDIDLNAMSTVIRISTVSATKTEGVFIKTTKTDRFRLVSITDRAPGSLCEQLDTARSRALADGRCFDPTGLVFTNDPAAVRPWRPELVTRRWERLRKRTGLHHVKIHGLRHFVATELLTAGIDVRTVANRLGHARTSTTLDI
jgi:integrase